MGQAIGQILPTAIGVAVSPLPIVAVVLMLVSARGLVNACAFIAGWWLGLAVVGIIVLSLASGGGATSSDGAPATWVNWLKLILGLLLLLVAAMQWKQRPHGDDEAPTPTWMGALDAFTPVKATGAGIVMSAVNPKNLLLAVAGAAAIAGAGISTSDETVAWIVFVAVASIGVVTPVVISLAMGSRSRTLLEELKHWMVQHNTVVMAVLLLVVGVKLIGDAISGFSS